MSLKNIKLGVDVKLQLALADSSIHDKMPPATDNNQADQCAHSPDLEWPKYGSMGAKKWPKQAENSRFALQICPEGLFCVGRGGKRLEHKRGHPASGQTMLGLFSR